MTHSFSWHATTFRPRMAVSGYAPHPGIHDVSRVLHFPAHNLVGKVYIHPWHNQPHIPPNTNIRPWHNVGPTQGRIEIPPLHEVFVSLNVRSWSDLQCLEHMHPFAIQCLTLAYIGQPAADASESSLVCLAHLQGLYALVLDGFSCIPFSSLSALPHLQFLQLFRPSAQSNMGRIGMSSWSISTLSTTPAEHKNHVLSYTFDALEALMLSNIALTDWPVRLPMLHTLSLEAEANYPPVRFDLPLLPAMAPLLQILSIASSSLTSSDITALTTLPDLTHLCLKRSIYDMEPRMLPLVSIEELGHLTPLKSLSIEYILPSLDELSQLPSLESLYVIYHNQRDFFLPLSQCARLHSLCVMDENADIPLQYSDICAINTVSTLDTLQLYVPIESGAIRGLDGHQQLHTLCIRGMTFVAQDIIRISQFINLLHLDISETIFENEHLIYLTQLHHLQTLNISDSTLDGHGIAYIIQLTQLHSLDISDTLVSPSGYAFVQTALPQTHILYEDKVSQ